MATGVTPFPLPPPPPSSAFSWTLTFPINAQDFDQARSQLESVNPAFTLDDIETTQLRQFLEARPAQEARSRWPALIVTGFATAGVLSAPIIACLIRPSIVQSSGYLFYSPLALVFSIVGAILFSMIFGDPLTSIGGYATRAIVWASVLDLFLFGAASVLAKAPHLPVWAAWPILSAIVSALQLQFAPIIPLLLLRLTERKPGARTRTPEAFIACHLFDVFAQSALTKVSPVPLTTRKYWVESLSDVATCVETSLARRLTGSDAILDSQINAELTKRAAAMRELAGQVALGGDIGPDIAARVRGLLRSACYFDWRSMPCSTVTGQSDRIRPGAWLRTAGRSLTIMILPLGTLLALSRGWIVLDPGQRSWANAILLGWIALIVLSLIDPNFEFTNKTLDTAGKFTLFGKFSKRD